MSARTNGRAVDPWWRRRRDVIAVLALIVASFVFTTDQVTEHELISPIDEYQYIGYYANVADQGIVRQGEEMPLFARQYLVCHGVRAIPEMPRDPAACKRPNSANYPIAGGTTADLYTPLYFLSTRSLAQPLIWAGVDFVTAGRAVGGFWLALGAVFLYLAMRRARTPVTVASGLSLILIGSLPAYWGTTYISTDATALGSGAVAAWLTMRALAGVPWSLVLLPVASVVATWFKLQNLIGFVVAATVLLLTAALQAAREPGGVRHWSLAMGRDRRVLSAVSIVVVSVAAQAAWLALRSSLALGPQPQFGIAVPLEGKHFVAELGNFLPRLGMGALDPSMTGTISLPVYAITTALAIGGAVGLALTRGVEASHRVIGISTVLIAVVSAPALALAVGAVEHNYVPLPWRYATSLLPWALLSAALLVDSRHRSMRLATLILGVVTFALAMMLAES